MKVRVTLLTENDRPIPDVPMDVLKRKVKDAWELCLRMIVIAGDGNDTAVVESVEILEDDE